ncbi:MAG: DUF998 domain-containing protein [Chloroflexi bacterium]|nr:MAG: DUF998 domain-containing protein [Chloroflexota bacterium]
MKTLTVGSNAISRPAAARQSLVRKALFACGVVSSVLYVAATVVAGQRWKGYSPVHQAVSELSAVGAPSRPLMVPLMLTYSALATAFGLGVWKSAGRKRSVRVSGALITGYGIASMTGPFTPMHLRGGERTLTDKLHLIGTGVDVLFIFLSTGFGANALGKRFRNYSIGTIVFLLGFGTYLGIKLPRIVKNVDADVPTPWAGVNERFLIFSYLLWVGALSVGLLRSQPESLEDEG